MILVSCSMLLAIGGGELPRLADPFKVLAGGQPIVASEGHAAPYLIDFDRDGKQDLLVGQYDDGKCRVYLNRGTRAEPRFDGFTWLQAGGADARMKPT